MAINLQMQTLPHGLEGNALGTENLALVTYDTGVLADYAATVDWGDGTPPTPATLDDQGDGAAVLAEHTYAAEGVFTVQVTVAGNGQTASDSTTLTVDDAPLTATGNTLLLLQGQHFSGTVASFTDGDPSGSSADLTASITWPTGTVPADNLFASGDGFEVTGNYTFEAAGVYTVPLPIHDGGGSTATATTTFKVAALSTVEGQQFDGVVVSTPAIDSGATVTIDWGDGVTSSGSVAAGSSGFDISGQHTYTEDGYYAIAVQVNNPGGNEDVLASSMLVADANLTASGFSVGGQEGDQLSVQVAHFTDANANATVGDFTAFIDWADGSISEGTVVVNPSGGFDVEGSNLYAAPGTYSITVDITDQGGATASASSTATIAEAPPRVTADAVQATEGATFSAEVGWFVDVDSGTSPAGYSATIQWGDGVTSSGTIAANGSDGFLVGGDHTYTSAGEYATQVTVSINATGATTTADGSADVADAGLTGTTQNITATEGQDFNGVVGSFTDGNPADTAGSFSATIDWGDDSAPSNGTVTANGSGGFNVTADHTYDTTDVYGVHVTITHNEGAITTVDDTATVLDAPITLQLVAIDPQDGVPFDSRIATFTADSNAVAGEFSGLIHFGDGHDSPADIRSNGQGGFDVYGADTYQQGSFLLSVSINSASGVSAQGSETVAVTNAPLHLQVPGIVAVEGVSFSGVVATFTDDDPLAAYSGFSATIGWDAGETPPVQTSGTILYNGSGGWDVLGVHTYMDDRSFPLHVVILNTDGSAVFGQGDGMATVTDPGLTLTGARLTATEAASFTTTVASFSTPDPDAVPIDYTAFIDFGDNHSSTGTVAPDGLGNFNIQGTHTYDKEGGYTVSTTLTDETNHSFTVQSTEIVLGAPLTLAVAQINPIEGQSWAGVVAHFTDADPNGNRYQATIDWGNGTVTPNAAITVNPQAGYDIHGAVTYFDETHATQPVTVTLRDNEGRLAVAQGPTDSSGQPHPPDITGSPLVLRVFPIDLSVHDVYGGEAITMAVALFTQNQFEPAGDFTAVIDWGDGTSPGTVYSPLDETWPWFFGPHSGSLVAEFPPTAAFRPQAFGISGSHSYPPVDGLFPVPHTVTVTITDREGNQTVGTGICNAWAEPSFRANSSHLVVTAQPVGSTEGQVFNFVLHFTDTNWQGDPAFAYQVSLNFGYGITYQSPFGVLLDGSGGNYTATVSMNYPGDGIYTVAYTITHATDTDLDYLYDKTSVTISEAPVHSLAIFPLGVPVSAMEGQAFQDVTVATFTSNSPPSDGPSFTATIDWGDGSNLPGGGSGGLGLGGGSPSSPDRATNST